MPLSFGVVIGVLTATVGAVLYLAFGRKRAALVVVGLGAAVALLTLAVIVLAVNSPM